METRHLGRTSLLVSRIGLGLAALGRPGYINIGHADDLERHYDAEAMEAHCHTVLDAAWELGVRYFDAARSYGRAEEFLANWLPKRKLQPAEITIGSKWGYTYTAQWRVEAEHQEIKNHTLPILHKQAAESRNLLGDHLDLYQIHSATLESGVLDDRAVLEELARMRDSGLRVGLSVSGPKQADTLNRAMDIRIGGKRLFDCVQATWNLLEPSAGLALQAAHHAGMGVIVKEALANGRLTSRNADPGFGAKRRILEEEARRLETTLDGLALAAVLTQPWVDVVLSGAATVDQLRSNLGSLTVKWDKRVAQQIESVAETPEEYWGKRSGLAWN
ncbi:MAG TPA: aldo/keto reductase [Gemmataceae bacterium]|jgi:aryl-alcohol dehydrogenase-like predicted oxidoreductase|nr:aldo/keto reductase [Gemmataceae bacterium]